MLCPRPVSLQKPEVSVVYIVLHTVVMASNTVGTELCITGANATCIFGAGSEYRSVSCHRHHYHSMFY